MQLKPAPHLTTLLASVAAAVRADPESAGADLVGMVAGLAIEKKRFLFTLARMVGDLAQREPHFNAAVRELVKAPKPGRRALLPMELATLLFERERLRAAGHSAADADHALAESRCVTVDTIEKHLTRARKVLPPDVMAAISYLVGASPTKPTSKRRST